MSRTIIAMLKRLLPGAASVLLAFVLVGCGDDTASDASDFEPEYPLTTRDDGPTCKYVEGGEAAKDVDLPPDTGEVVGKASARIAAGVGDIDITLDAENTPCTVNSFVSLAEQGYFDDMACHRMTTKGIFVLQCGSPVDDPQLAGSAGPGYSFADELTGKETYPSGTLAMANAGPNTNGSQFFLVYEDSQLPPAYTVFGTMSDDGVDVVKDVAKDGTDESNGPGDGVPNTEVRVSDVDFGV